MSSIKFVSKANNSIFYNWIRLHNFVIVCNIILFPYILFLICYYNIRNSINYFYVAFIYSFICYWFSYIIIEASPSSYLYGTLMMESQTHSRLFTVCIHMQRPWCGKICVIVLLTYWTNKDVVAIQTLHWGRSNKISIKFYLSYYTFIVFQAICL